MGLTVRDAISLGYLDGCVLLGGEEGLDREIQVVSVMEVPDACMWVRGGELVVTAFFSLMARPEDQVQLIESMALKGAAGIIVFYVGMYCQEIAPSLVDRANQLGFPLFRALDARMAYGDIIKPIMADLSLRQLAKDISTATHAIDDPSSLETRESLVENLSRGLGSPVMMVDSRFRLVQPADGEGRHADLLEKCRIKYQAHQYSEVMNGILAIEVDSRTTILVASILDARKQPSNYILVVGKPGTSSDQGKLMLLSIAIRMFSVIQSHKRTLGHIETLSRDSYVSDLLTGRVKSAEVIIERGRLVGLNMQNKRRALVLTWKNPWPGLNGIYKSLSAQPENVCFRGHSRLVVMREPCLTTEDDDYRLRQELTRIWTSSGKPGWDVGFAIGIGLIQPGVEFLFRSHMEACNALRLHSILAGRLGYCDDPPLVFHDTVGYLAMIERLASDPMHRAAAHALLTPLLESDQQHGGHLLRTMLVHLWEGCNIRRTASRLFVHRNTLSYRLRKISELLGEDPFGRTNMPKYLLAVGIEVFPQEPPAPDSTESAVPVAL